MFFGSPFADIIHVNAIDSSRFVKKRHCQSVEAHMPIQTHVIMICVVHAIGHIHFKCGKHLQSLSLYSVHFVVQMKVHDQYEDNSDALRVSNQILRI